MYISGASSLFCSPFNGISREWVIWIGFWHEFARSIRAHQIFHGQRFFRRNKEGGKGEEQKNNAANQSDWNGNANLEIGIRINLPVRTEIFWASKRPPRTAIPVQITWPRMPPMMTPEIIARAF